MYDILKLNWNQMMESDYNFKCHSRKKIIEIEGACLSDALSKSSSIVIFYNLYDGSPYLLVEKTYEDVGDISDIELEVPELFSISVYSLEDGDATEIVCTHKAICAAIDAESAGDSADESQC